MFRGLEYFQASLLSWAYIDLKASVLLKSEIYRVVFFFNRSSSTELPQRHFMSNGF